MGRALGDRRQHQLLQGLLLLQGRGGPAATWGGPGQLGGLRLAGHISGRQRCANQAAGQIAQAHGIEHQRRPDLANRQIKREHNPDQANRDRQQQRAAHADRPPQHRQHQAADDAAALAEVEIAVGVASFKAGIVEQHQQGHQHHHGAQDIGSAQAAVAKPLLENHQGAEHAERHWHQHLAGAKGRLDGLVPARPDHTLVAAERAEQQREQPQEDQHHRKDLALQVGRDIKAWTSGALGGAPLGGRPLGAAGRTAFS